jgi:hypothetical protein
VLPTGGGSIDDVGTVGGIPHEVGDPGLPSDFGGVRNLSPGGVPIGLGSGISIGVGGALVNPR